ncbi:PREDICTED: uncharacterized protein LOC105562311 [Vollenhovia emeryi]|uniref:uncharacterized protein LOC105562311 n=1 Tax=Vollenhovia emeryi TaxID=411798 RepID=UPI0005F4DD6F|nr:PREDICTED: uncharacterized protein LOC105562311 [Vollenhovia emeryi]
MVEATSQTRSDNINDDGERRETRDYSLWTSLQMGKIWSQMHDACKNVVKLAATSVGRVVKDAPKSERSQRNSVEVADAMLVKSSSSSCAGKICGETCRKNLMRSKNGEKTEARQERAIGNVGKYREDTEDAPMRKNSRAIAPSRRDMQKRADQNAEKEDDKGSCVTYNGTISSDQSTARLPVALKYERDKYWDIVEFPLRNETFSHDEDVHSQSRLSEYLTYLEHSTCPGLRNRGGSDNRDFTTRDEQKSVQRIHEARSIERNQNSTSENCICHDKSRETSVHCTDRSSQHVACYERFATTDRQAIRVSATSRNDRLHHESRSTNISSPEDNGRMETPATPEQTRFCAETERSFTSAVVVAAVSSTATGLTVHSSQNDPDKPIASTSKWGTTSPASPGKSRRNSRSPFCATAMKFWRRRSSVDNKTIAAVLKRGRRGIGRKELSSTAATTYDSGAKITQIEPSTVQTPREGNKSRAYVNVQVQTPDAIVARVLSEFLLSGEKKRRVLMSIMLQSESGHDVREVETQTSSNDLTSAGINMFGYPGTRPQSAIATASRTVQCFVCDKQDCYEIRRSDSSVTLDETLIAEYPETSDLNDHLTEQKAAVRIPP